MTVLDPMNNTIRTIGAHVLSLAVHVGAIGILFVVAVISPPKKLETIKVQLVSAAELTAVPDAPPAPARPEPPAPEPEPAAPEPPAPEPPAPEPEPPPPPKPVVTPPPEPPKAPLSKPTPPKPEPPKPTPVKSHRESLRERLAAAETKTAAPQPTTPRSPATPRRSEAELAESFTRGIPKSGTSRGGTAASGASLAGVNAQMAADETNYAEQVVRPLFYARWQQPSRGELQQSWPTPVEVTFTVLADGRIAGWKLTKRSNSDAMNRSVEALMRQTTQLTPFSQLGIRSASLRIVVSMELGARI